MYPPYALGILNTVLKKNNYNSSITDLNFEVFNYIYNNKSCNSIELTKKWKSVLEKKLIDHDVDIVGVSCTFTMNHENMIEIFNEVKKFNKSIITIAGGVHVSNATEFVLKEGKNIDFAHISLQKEGDPIIKKVRARDIICTKLFEEEAEK